MTKGEQKKMLFHKRIAKIIVLSIYLFMGFFLGL